MWKALPIAPVVAALAFSAVDLHRTRAMGSDGSSVALPVQRRSGEGQAVRERLSLDPAKTTVVVIDMWDRHWCKTYTRRVANLVPRMNQTLAAARKLGMQVVFAPSDVLGPYKDVPQRKAMQSIPPQPLPARVAFDPPGPPGGRDCCECGPQQPCKPHSAWTRQQADLKIAPEDLIGDCNNDRELANLCRQRGIDTLVYMGVASNMCVIHRAMGMVNMRRHGLRTLFVCDLVEAITANGFDPARKQKDPNFTPARGTAEVQRYLEQHVAPSVESRQLIAAAGLDPHAADKRPHLVFVISEPEYQSSRTLPAFAQRHLAKDFRLTFLHGNPKDGNDVPGLEALYDADLLVLSMRRRTLSVPQMDHLERYLRAGKPLVAVRTSCVPFQVDQCPSGCVVWRDFDQEVLGCHYQGYDPQSRKTGCDVWVAPEAAGHAVLKGIEPGRFHSPSWPYKVQPLAKTATPLLLGRWSAEQPVEPLAWTNTYQGGRVFYTSLGHPDDFQIEPFNRLLANAVRWALQPGD